MHSIRIVAAAAAILAGVGAAAAQEVAPPKGLLTAGKLTYGVAATFAPFEYTVDGKYVGFDIEFGEALAKKMGLAVEIANIEFKGLIPALQGKRIDIVNSAMYINPERAQQVDFVPYMKIGNEVIVKKGNPKKIGGRADLCGMTVAVTLGGIQQKYATEDNETCTKAGKKAVTILTFPTAQDSSLALRQGRADAHYDSTPGAVKAVTELPNEFEVAGPTFEANTQIGIAVRKGDAEMKGAIEKAIQAVVKDGTYAKLLDKYKLPKTGSLF